MYVDLNNTRIRLSQIVTLTEAEWQQLKPPYSIEAFYYLSDVNALLKYTPEDEWVQINSTKVLSEALKALTTRVTTAEDTIKNHTTAINALNATVTDPTTGLAATKAIADAAKTTAEAALPKTQFETWRDGDLATDIRNAKQAGDDAQAALNAHAALKTNPHEVTAEQVGLGNVNNTSDMDKPVSTAQAAAITKAKTDIVGAKGDAATADTIYGAKTAAAAAMTKATEAAAAAAANLTSINAEVARVDAILKDANASMVTFKQVYEAIEDVKDNVNSLGDTYATDAELNAAKEAILGVNHTGTVKEAAAAAATAQAGVNANAAAIEALAARVTTEIQTADALVYVGTVSAASGLPKTGVKVGHTYKVTTDILKSEFTNVNFDASTSEDAMIHTGDLLIATGTETDGVITSNLAWDHIPSGYHADYVPEMSTAFESRDGVVSAVVNLTSAHAATDVTGDLGKFTVTGATGSAITIANGGNNAISIGMTWGTF
jgi:hypothetical protein